MGIQHFRAGTPTANNTSFGNGGGGSPAWAPLKIGAGGFIRGVDINPNDSSLAAWTDTYGAWLWNPSAPSTGNAGGTGVWEQLVNTTSISTSDPAVDLNMILQTWSGNGGVYALRMAPSNSSIMYMVYNGYMFKSTNKGSSWTRQTGWSNVTSSDAAPNVFGVDSECGPRMVVHPTDPLTAFVGLQTNAARYTRDGGTTWTAISTGQLPLPTAGGTWFHFHPSTPATMYACSYGNGVYKSTDTGATWTKISGSGTSNTTLVNARTLKVSPSGDLWVCDASGNANNIWKYSGTTWTNPTTLLNGFNNNGGSMYHSVCFDPNNSSRIILVDGQMTMTQSTDGGTTWFGAASGSAFGPPSYTAADIPYLALTGSLNGFVDFLPGTSTLLCASGVGLWTCTPPSVSTSSATWASKSAGIEQLVSNVLVSPPGGDLIATHWDRCIFRLVSPYSTYPSTYEPPAFVFPPGAYCVDWASADPTFIVAGDANGTMHYSTNKGVTWNTKSGFPGTGGTDGGGLAVLNSNVMLRAQTNGDLYVTTDGGNNWTSKASYFSTNFGLTSGGWGGFANTQNIQTCCADRNDGVSLYAYNNKPAGSGGGVYRSQDNGATWTKRKANDAANGLPSNGNEGGYEKMRSVPGRSGHLLFSGGPAFQPTHPQNYPFYICTDGGATWSNINSNVKEVWAFGVGKQIGSYPRIAIFGWVSGVPGIFISDDQGATWTKIGEQTTYGTYDLVRWVEVDNNDGNVYVTFLGSGAAKYA